MFAHQVADDLLKDGDMYLKPGRVETTIYFIRKAQHFHFGVVEDMLGFCDKYAGLPMFIGPLGGVKLPYRVCWFDYVVNSKSIQGDQGGKFAILITETEDAMWEVSTFTFFQKRKGWSMDPAVFMIDPATGITRNGGVWKSYEQFGNYDNMMARYYTRLAQQNLGALNGSLLFLSCKNIEKQLVLPSEPLNRKRKASGKTSLFSYHILILKPTTQRQKSLPQHLWTNRIHLRMGHFKSYTEENPLFGRVVGRFWWQPCVAGRNKKGIVVKEYRKEEEKIETEENQDGHGRRTEAHRRNLQQHDQGSDDTEHLERTPGLDL
jgi:hypothetical protein